MNAGEAYAPLDRMLHRVAFSSPMVQFTAADVEKAIYGRRFGAIRIERPIFITSLPRAGTTMLLERLAGHPSLATSSYRDMPFVLAPLLWQRLSRLFRKPSAPRERAHGDGMLVGYDSPEAFEEILWRMCWPGKFADDGIALWSEDEAAGDFREALESHMQRVIAVRSNGGPARRYVSKNNANIARLGLLRFLFPDAVLVVPFRSPLDQAASLLGQHLRFLDAHRRDPFAREYMADVGHLEFGALHRPIRFDGMDWVAHRFSADRIDYWLAYWIAAFTHVLEHRSEIVLLSYEHLCAAGAAGLRTLGRRLGLPDALPPGGREALHAPRRRDEGTSIDADLLRDADALHRRLLALNIV